MNQGNKISSVRPGTINIELGLDLHVLLYYRGLRSVQMIFTDYSQHIPKITASPVCTAIKNDINSIKLCLSFYLKIQVVYFWKMIRLLGDFVPQIPAGAYWAVQVLSEN